MIETYMEVNRNKITRKLGFGIYFLERQQIVTNWSHIVTEILPVSLPCQHHTFGSSFLSLSPPCIFSAKEEEGVINT